MQLNKLTPGEITRTVDKIRKRYEEYIYKFFKQRALKRAFEDRYLQAIRSGVDISSFLMAEIGAIEELIEREEKIVAGPVRRETRKKESVSEKIDKLIEENRKKIQKYPDIVFHKDANEEVRHLLGALSELEQKYWGILALVLRDTAHSRSSATLMNLESQLRYLGSLGDDRVSSGLSRYLYQLNRFPRDYQAIEREEKEFILESAFFLNDLYEILVRESKNYGDLSEDNRERLEETRNYVLGVIMDFRLKDLKRKK